MKCIFCFTKCISNKNFEGIVSLKITIPSNLGILCKNQSYQR